MEKRRMRLDINGVVCGLITQESEEYMRGLADEVGSLMRGVLEASPYITREAAALTAALSCCDDARKNGRKAAALQERVDELEVESELWQEEKEELLKSVVDSQKDARLQERVARLEAENTALADAARQARELEEKAASLEDENSALRESASMGAQALRELSALREKCQALEEELAKHAPQDGEGEKLLRLEGEIEELQRQAEEQSARAQKAEDEKAAAVSAAKRAMEEAKDMMDELREEAQKAREEARRLREQGASPALDALERQAQKAQEAEEAQPPAPAEEPKPKEKPAPRKKRKNPLRYEEDFQQEGFVSFFEKKG
ncbi:hypothetical protein D1841_08125 [Neglecta sp. X4]|uniref:cell division protein ZapA n=1 Tax=unclassified Neglectibacter TaxID=2632164 RepID=UPI00136C8ACE|nr:MULTISPECIES: cell division protein ZapA [unclassified Neglectibacter]NBI17848.1 hypothetical protein [Neglectibacter sp. 59]NBJ73275.1 hypothetical protein [Neglectibacter sp. X4]NCE81187.1 hypothetical protein [Neglectibacter sp. X58]